MKFMKLGSRPDTFYTTEAVRSVSSEITSDLIVQVKGNRFLLHKVNFVTILCVISQLRDNSMNRHCNSYGKFNSSVFKNLIVLTFSITQFPLLSKCLRLQKLCADSPETSQHQIVQIPDLPGGVEAFELCAKFCYGITITLSAYNIVSVRCAAEYLQMTEDVEKGNLKYKLEVFFNSCILHGWRDSIITLQSTRGFGVWAEDLGIMSRCIDAIASKVLAHPSMVSLSHSYSRRVRDDISCNGSESLIHNPTTKGWWAEDIAELGIDLYWRTMIAIKSGGKVPGNLIGDALRIYASRWLPNISKYMNIEKEIESDHELDSTRVITSKHKLLLESIVSLLPAEKGAVSSSFLLKLLKAVNIVKASSSTKMELARRVGIQLEDATVNDLLIPSLSYTNDTIYDVDVVRTILEQFTLQGQSPPTSPLRTRRNFERRRSRSAENADFEFQESRRSSSAPHSSKLNVAKLVDGYLQEIARDVKLPLSKFLAIADSVPDFARLQHDDLYRAIDTYLKGHPELNKSERKRLCRILDCKRLSVAVCMHAAQNEMLPLRVVVQVLFCEQARAATAGGHVNELPRNIKALLSAHNNPGKPTASFSTNATTAADDQWSVSGLKSPKSKVSTLKPRLGENKDLDDNGEEKSSKAKTLCMLPNRPKRMFSRLCSINRTPSH